MVIGTNYKCRCQSNYQYHTITATTVLFYTYELMEEIQPQQNVTDISVFKRNQSIKPKLANKHWVNLCNKLRLVLLYIIWMLSIVFQGHQSLHISQWNHMLQQTHTSVMPYSQVHISCI